MKSEQATNVDPEGIGAAVRIRDPKRNAGLSVIGGVVRTNDDRGWIGDRGTWPMQHQNGERRTR